MIKTISQYLVVAILLSTCKTVPPVPPPDKERQKEKIELDLIDFKLGAGVGYHNGTLSFWGNNDQFDVMASYAVALDTYDIEVVAFAEIKGDTFALMEVNGSEFKVTDKDTFRVENVINDSVVVIFKNDWWVPKVDGSEDSLGIDLFVSAATIWRYVDEDTIVDPPPPPPSDTTVYDSISWRIFWDRNKEPDMESYRLIFLNSAGDTLTHIMTADTSVKLNVSVPLDAIYHMLLTAIDTAGNESDPMKPKTVFFESDAP